MSARDARPSIEFALAEAGEKTSKSEWMKAAEVYLRVASQNDTTKNQPERANVLELLAGSYSKAAFQAGTRQEFQRRMSLSQNSQREATGLYDELGLEVLAKRSEARATFAGFWMLDPLAEKRSAIQKCVSLAQNAARLFEIAGDKKNLAESQVDLLTYLEKAVHLSAERKQLLDYFEAAVETAWRIISDDKVQDERVLEAANVLVQLYMSADYVLEKPRYEELERRLDRLRERIPELSQEIGTRTADALATETLMALAADLEGDVPKTLALFEKGLQRAKELGDRYMIARLEIIAAAMMRWAALSEEFVEKRKELLDKAVDLAQDSIRNLQPSTPGDRLKRAYGILVDAYNYIALTVETNIDKKRTILRNAIDSTRNAMIYETHSFLTGMGHQMSRAMYLLSTMDVGGEEKTRLLNEALPIRQETVHTLEVLSPHSFSRGAMINYLALIKAELSELEADRERKLNLLKEAASDMGQCVKLCTTITGIFPALPGQVRAQAQYSESQGDILQKLYEMTAETPAGQDAVHAYQESISHLSKSGNLAPIAPIRWKIAQTYDLMREYHEGSESFRAAADEYRLAGRKTHGLAETFDDYARYMEAWSIIEEAKQSHDREQYSASAESYAKAAEHLRRLTSWNLLSRHYSACSFLELGEGMSRQERQQSAMESFSSAKTNFQEAIRDLEQMNTISEPSLSPKELKNSLERSRGRLKYSQARLQLEEAKILDSRMEEEASAAKYMQASNSFRSLLDETRHQPTRTELDSLGLLCEAWAKMKSAEVSASPEKYAEAASIFRLVESKATSKKTRLAALANASMCKALESGCAFRRTRDPGLYQTIKTNLETAADFYEEAGIRRAADWTRATQRYFDALTYLRQAEVEIDPKKKAELFQLAENHLQLAATIYGEAGYAAKRQESLQHLRRAKEEKRLLLMPVDVLQESPTVADVTITPMSLADDRSSGLERYESAHVVGTMNLSSADMNAGERVSVDFQMVNIGKTPATLARIENLASKGLELLLDTRELSIEDHAINFRGRRLEYLKNFQTKIWIRARRKGTYELRPQLTFLDEKGNQAAHNFKPAILRVKEIGVLGWIRGPS